jgi:hypothetical protein
MGGQAAAFGHPYSGGSLAFAVPGQGVTERAARAVCAALGIPAARGTMPAAR